MRRYNILLTLLILCFAAATSLSAQTSASALSAVPGQVQFAGRIAGGSLTAEGAEGTEGKAGVRGVTFALYGEQAGGNALWMETQNVSVDASGAYSALLGAATTGGIPQEIFANSEARWLEVSYTAVDGSVMTQPRVLLVSVPYAIKAGDAQTLGGLPASAFVLNPHALSARVSAAGGVASAGDVLPSTAVAGTGTANKIAKWIDGAGTLGDSLLFDNGFVVGLGTTTPSAALHISLQDASIILGGAGTHSLSVQGTGSNGRLGQDNDGFFFSSDTNGKALKMLTQSNNVLQEWMRITAGGQIGMGTQTPSAALHLSQQDASFLIDGAGTHSIALQGPGSNGRFGQDGEGMFFASDTNGRAFKFLTNNGALNEWMRITSTGNVGVGTTTPSQKLHVVGNILTTGTATTAGVVTSAFTMNVGASLSGKVLTSDANGVGTWQTPAGGGGGGTVTTVGSGTGLTGGPITTTGTLSIDTAVVPRLGTANTFTGDQTINGNATVSNNLTVDTTTLTVDALNNRVGVGTNAPTQALDVNGSVRVRTGGSLVLDSGTTLNCTNCITSQQLADNLDITSGTTSLSTGDITVNGSITINEVSASPAKGATEAGMKADGPTTASVTGGNLIFGTKTLVGQNGVIGFSQNPTSPNIVIGLGSNQVDAGVLGSTIGGGGAVGVFSGFPTVAHRVSDHFGYVGGGTGNKAGNLNLTLDDAQWATVSGGLNNTASAQWATVGGGNTNAASGISSTIGGGDHNQASNGPSTVAGGQFNVANGDRSGVGGGSNNIASGGGSYIGGGGGPDNASLGNTASGNSSFIGGGQSNLAGGTFGTIAGGQSNVAGTINSTLYPTVGGGWSNEATGPYSTIPGGYDNSAAASFSFAAGQRARSLHMGSFVWADSQAADFSSTATDQFLIRAAGGVGIGTAAPTSALQVNGTVKATAFQGDGSLLTNVPSSGASLGANTFSATQTISSGNLALPSTSSASSGGITIAGSSFAHRFGTADTFVGQLAGNFTTTGNNNTGVGFDALAVVTSATANTAVGASTLEANSTGSSNTAVGNQALQVNSTATANTIVGAYAATKNTTGAENTGLGYQVLFNNVSGNNNTAVGSTALHDNTGSNNIAIGYQAGFSATTGSNNIYIGNSGVAAESATTRIGSGSQTKTFISGIRGITTVNANAIAVVIDSAGQLGTISSSRRFKQDIDSMGEVSSRIMKLRPVTFRYKQPAADGAKPIQYGLIAEEVEEIFPELVAYGADGQVETVKYHILPSLLLNEVQRQQRTLDEQAAAIQQQREENAQLKSELAELRQMLQQVQQRVGVQVSKVQ